MKHLVAGLILLVLGVCGIIFWWYEFGEFLRGVIPVAFVLVGLAALGAGINEPAEEAEFEDKSEQRGRVQDEQEE